MASEHNIPEIQRGVAEPIANTNEGAPSGAGLQPSSGQESRDPFSSREGSPHHDGPPQAGQNLSAQPSGFQTIPVASPSDLERGMAGYSNTRPPLNLLNTQSQGLGSGHPLPSPPILRRPTDEYDTRPRSNHSPHSQRGDPFSGSPDGSPGRQSNQNLPPSRSQNEQIGAHVRHVLDDERHRLVGRLQGNQQSASNSNSNEGIGARLRHALEDDGNNLLDHIPGSHQQDPARANEGFGVRLRHAAEDYIHETFPNYNLPSLPGRLLHPGDDAAGTRRSRVTDPRLSRTQSVIDHVVPVRHISEVDMIQEKYTPGSVSARLESTLRQAKEEREKYAVKAKYTGLALNIAIGLQVLLGSLTTGLSAVATQGKSSAVSTTILGALATLVASYLARARGSNEPELSITRVKDLEQFIRECTNFQTDHGEDMGHEYDAQIEGFRMRFEGLLGNANGERKLSSAGVQVHS